MSNVINNAVVVAINEGIEGVSIPAFARPQVDAAIGVIAADLEVKAEGIADTLRSIAAANGLSESIVENALIEAGLVDAPEPEVEVEPETLEQKIDRLLATQESQATDIARLLTVARDNGLLRG